MIADKRKKHERCLSLLAHAIGPVMIITRCATGSPRWMLLIAATTAIYIGFANHSPYVKHHARQALTLQLFSLLFWLPPTITGTALCIVMLLLFVISAVVLLGLLLIPTIVLSQPALVLLSLALPLSVFVLGCRGIWHTARGHDFDYPVLADLLDRYLGICYER